AVFIACQIPFRLGLPAMRAGRSRSWAPTVPGNTAETVKRAATAASGSPWRMSFTIPPQKALRGRNEYAYPKRDGQCAVECLDRRIVRCSFDPHAASSMRRCALGFGARGRARDRGERAAHG